MVIPRRPQPNPNYDSGRRDLTISGHDVSAALTELGRDDPARRNGATHVITVTPAVNAASGTMIVIDGVIWRVVTSRAHPSLRAFRELLVAHHRVK